MFYYINFDDSLFLFLTFIMKLGGGKVWGSETELSAEECLEVGLELLKEEDVLIVEQQIINELMELTSSFGNVSVVNC